MKAVQFHVYGNPDTLRYEDVERPAPADGEVLVRVAATSFNPLDATIRAGFMSQIFDVPLPHIPGLDVAGTVEQLGAGVTSVRVGDAVYGMAPITGQGASAEYVVVPAGALATAPTTVPLADAAALPATGLTAWQAVYEHAAVQPGQRVLVNGAGGGVGGYAVQLAKRAGAYVVATASARSADAVRAFGADEVVDYTTTAVTGEFDVVLNLVVASEPDMAGLVALVRDGGVLVSTAGPAPEDSARKVRTTGMQMRADADQLAALAKAVDAGELKLDITGRYPLRDLATVHERSAAGALHGKVIITPGS